MFVVGIDSGGNLTQIFSLASVVATCANTRITISILKPARNSSKEEEQNWKRTESICLGGNDLLPFCRRLCQHLQAPDCLHRTPRQSYRACTIQAVSQVVSWLVSN
jgi:hypothetical protein